MSDSTLRMANVIKSARLHLESIAERQYLYLMAFLLHQGIEKTDRTGTGTRSTFGHQFRFNLSDWFPLLTTKKVFLKGVIIELLWILSGSTNINYLKANGVHIWDEWADANGELGPVYGYQWRHWRGISGREIDQIKNVIETLKKNPHSRRHIVTAWNPDDVDKMALPPCHAFFQFYVDDEERLSCQMYQRSADLFLGVPFNIASYSLLTLMVAQVCGYKPGEFIITFGDVHLYLNHLDQAREQLEREPRPFPTMILNPEVKDIFSFKYEDFKLENYNPHPKIDAPIAV